MKAIDTNVLVRFLTRDDAIQSSRVLRRFKEAEQAKETLFVPLVVVLETIWVLDSVYTVPRADILAALEDLLRLPVLDFESPDVIRGLISAAARSPADLSDLLIGHAAKAAGCEVVLTFDRRASATGLFEVLT